MWLSPRETSRHSAPAAIWKRPGFASRHSDGKWLPEQLVAGADKAGLDFMVSTEHNTATASGIWGHHARPDLLIIDGEEITSRNGHYVAAGLPAGTWIDWRYRSVDGRFPRFAREIHRHRGLVIAAHAHATCIGCQWKFGYGIVDPMEVWNGPWTPDDEVTLQAWNGLLVAEARRGRWIPGVGSSDSHREGQIIGLPHTVVLADDLTRSAILAGVRAGRSYIAESSAITLGFTASAGGRKAGVGERLGADAAAEVTIELEVQGVPGGVVRFSTDGGQIYEQRLPESGNGKASWRTRPRISAYVRAEVRKPDGAMAALTNPIFLGRPRG